ncbi:MAG: nitroreductase [Bradymonadaceae bacterium]
MTDPKDGQAVRDCLSTRRTVHRFSPEPIPDGAVDRALEAAVAAPNHKLTYPWRFTRVGSEGRAAIEDLYVRLKEESKGALTDEQERAYRRKVGQPPELVVPSQVLADDDFTRREDYAAVACAIQNLMISLWSEEVHSKWTTGSVTRHPETYDLLGIDGGEEEIVGFVWIGYVHEDRRDREKPPRPSLDEIVRDVS